MLLSLDDKTRRSGPALPAALFAGALTLVLAFPAHVDAQNGAGTNPDTRAVAQAPAPGGSGDAEAPSPYDRIWTRFSQWYRNDTNPVVQRVQFSGRFQHDFSALRADEGGHDESNIRRLRFGPRVTLFRNVVAHVEIDLNPQERDPFYVRFTDAYVQWNHSSRLSLTVGKQGVPFTVEGATSSKELLTIDRSNLANNLWFPQEYMPGVSVSGRAAGWGYRGGVYSAGAMNREFGEFSGDYFVLARAGYDLAGPLNADEAVLTGSYVYQHADPDNTFTRQLEHVLSAELALESGRWGLQANLAAAQGYLGQSDLWAVMAMPFVDLTDRLQAVGRYTYVDGRGENGVRLGTYESRVVGGRGDEFNELYLGANYYFYDHKLKLQSGVQWADMNDRAGDGGEYSGVSWTTGLRVSW